MRDGADSSPEAFLESVAPRLRAYLYYAGAGRDDVEDLVQDTCLQAHGHWRELSVHPEPVAWVLRVARNALLNRRKRAAVEERALTEARAEARAASALHGPRRAPVDEAAEEAELSAAVQDALSGLRPAQREAVVGKIWGGLTWSQIGRGLGVSDDTAARLFARGLRAMRPKLGRFLG